MKIKLILLLLLGLATAAQAQFTYTAKSGVVTITRYTGSNDVVAVPSSLAGLPVVSIGAGAFYATKISDVLLPDSVTNIGYGAFYGCKSLTNVTLGNSVARIGDWAFNSCPKLLSVCCRGNAPKPGGGNVFSGDRLATVYYLSGAIGWKAKLQGRPTMFWNPEVPFNFITNNDAITITGYTGSGQAVTIPDRINFLPVISLGDSAFYYLTGLTNIMIPASVTSIGRGAFSGCSGLAAVTIPKNVANFGDYVFWGCSGLIQVTIANGVKRLGDFMFDYCTSLTNIIIPNSVVNMGYDTFANCSSLTSVTIPNSVTNLADTVFGNCTHLVSIVIPDSVTRIGDATFAGCTRLTGIYFSGNAPDYVGLDIFHDAPNVIVYYLSNTTGWETSFAGRPTMVWSQPSPISSAVVTQNLNSPVFKIDWTGSATVVVEACTNLFNPLWEPIQTNAVSGDACHFSDSQWTNYPCRFYRLRSP